MPIPLLAGALGVAGKLGSGLTDILGGNAAAGALKAANGRARTDLTTGYSNAQGYQQPLYDTGKSNLSDLSSNYAAGKFNNPTMTPYQFDPQSVFKDPEYAAQMRAGTDAINNSAEAKGRLFSGANDKALTQFGQDTFAGRSDDLYNRGFNAQNTAFNQNAQSNLSNFNEGNTLAGYAAPAANNLSNLATGQGNALAGNDQFSGQIRAGNILNTSTALGSGLSDLAGGGSQMATLGSDPLSAGSGSANIGQDPQIAALLKKILGQ